MKPGRRSRCVPPGREKDGAPPGRAPPSCADYRARAGQHHGQVGGEIAVARVARTLEDKLDPVGAEPRGYPRELGAERVAHSPAAFFFLGLEEVDSVGPVLAAGSFFVWEDESDESDLPVELSAAGAAGFSWAPFRPSRSR